METEVIIPGIACVLMAGAQFRVDMFRVFCVLQIVREGGRDVTQTLHTVQMSCSGHSQ